MLIEVHCGFCVFSHFRTFLSSSENSEDHQNFQRIVPFFGNICFEIKIIC